MAGKEIAVKKYVVRLDAEERDRLGELIRKAIPPGPSRTSNEISTMELAGSGSW